MSKDVIADFLTIIRNGIMVAKPFVVAPYSKMRFSIANILQEEGFVRDVVVLEEDNKKHVKIVLKYVDGESAIHKIDRKSRPGRRYYVGVDGIKPVIGGLGLSILTTSQGIITHKQAKKDRVGGEILCTVW